MRINVHFFALYRDLVGTGNLALDVADDATARVAVDELRARGGGFERLPEEPVVAVNLEYARLDRALEDGDELALLPPVAGG